MEAKTWKVGNSNVELLSDGRFKIVKLNGEVLFNNRKNGGSFRGFWRKFEDSLKPQEWNLVSERKISKFKLKLKSKNKSNKKHKK